MSCYEIPWFYQDFKSENLFFKYLLSSRRGKNELVTRDRAKSSQTRNETCLQL